MHTTLVKSMGLKKWMAVVRSDKKDGGFSLRKRDRKEAKRLSKLQKVANARHQPIEKLMEEAFTKGNKRSKKRMKRLQKEESLLLEIDGHEEEKPKSKRRRKRERNSSETNSDADLSYERYLEEVLDKKHQIALEGDDAKQDDIDIHRYSKLLGIKEGKNVKKPKSFTNDGLDYLLDFCDSDSRKRIIASSVDQEINLKGDELSEEDDVADDDDVGIGLCESGSEERAPGDEQSGECSSVVDDNVGNENIADEKEKVEDSEGNESDYKEDIYGRKVSRKTGRVVNFDLKGAQKKLEDLEAKEGDPESKMKIDRVLLGTLNRLQDQLLSLYALFLALIHTFTSEEISAYFVEVFLREFVGSVSRPQVQDDKQLENSVVFVAHVMNFHVIKPTVILELLEKVRENLNVDTLQLVVTLSTYSYKTLRRQHWKAFSEELSKISSTFEAATFSTLPRAKFLGETLVSLQKHPPTSVDFSVTEHYSKLFHGLKKKNKVVSDKELGMSLDDLLHAEERGRWWVVGSAFNVTYEGAAVSGSGGSSQNVAVFPDHIMQLARRAKMNTEVRRNIFCTVATSDDEDVAFERLLRLSLKGQQEREIVYVLMMMSLKEKTFNAFYPVLMARFCEFDKRFALTTQYAIWDRIREAETLKIRARTRLADVIHHIISLEVLPITVLKVVEWGTLTSAVSSVIRRVFKLLSSSSLTKVRRIFAPLFVRDKNPLLTEGLRLFLSVNFPESEVYKKIEEYFVHD